MQSDERLKEEPEKVGATYTASFNRQDAAGIAALYADGGRHINPLGPRTDIEELYKSIFKAGFDHQESNVDAAWRLGSDTAIAIGQYQIAGKDRQSGLRIERGGYWTAAYVCEAGIWKIGMQTAVPK